MDRRVYLTVFAFLLTISLAAASYQAVGCGPYFSCPAGGSTVWCKHDDSTSPPTADTADCTLQCAKACGEATKCIESGATPAQTCEVCCSSATTCGSAYNPAACLIPIGPLAVSCACNNACIGTCKFNTSFCYMILIIIVVAGIMAAVMILLLALKWIISDDPQGRTDARRGIWYVIVGIIIIVSAGALVSGILGANIPCASLIP